MKINRRSVPCWIVAALLLAGCGGTMPSGYGLSSGTNGDALKRQEAADAPQPTDSKEFYVSLIKQMQGDGLYFASLAHIDAFEKKYGAAPEVTLLRADALRETGQAPGSEAAYRQLLDTPLAGQGYHGLGLLAATRGDFVTAVPALSKAVSLDPTNVMFLNDMGFALMSQGDLEAARVPVAQAAELAQGNLKVVSNLVLYLLLANESARATSVMDKAKLPLANRTAVQRLAIEIRGRIAAQQAAAVAARAPRQTMPTSRVVQIEQTSQTGQSARVAELGPDSGPMQPMLERFSPVR